MLRYFSIKQTTVKIAKYSSFLQLFMRQKNNRAIYVPNHTRQNMPNGFKIVITEYFKH